MNVNRLINMGLRMLMRRGVGTAMNRVARKGQNPGAPKGQTQPSNTIARDTGRKAGRALRVMRRFMR